MNWTETSQRLLELLPDADLPERWQAGIDLSRADLRSASLRSASLRSASLRGANLEGANLEGANLGGANLTDADLTDANLGGANLRGANLRGANLGGANLTDANLDHAYLDRANLTGAHLYGADLTGASDIFAFTLGKHFAFFQPSSGYCRIGCIGMHISEWLERHEEVGRENGYSVVEIARYGAMLRLCAEWQQVSEPE